MVKEEELAVLLPNKASHHPTFAEAFWFWLKLGFISFGGPAGQIGIMHEFLVEKKKWISESRFMHALNYCMLLPGPEAQQLATYIGWLLHGVRGGLVAGALFILPSMFILLGLSAVYVTFGKLAWVAALFYGLKPAVVAIIIVAMIKIGKKSLRSALHVIVAIGSFAGIFLLDLPFPLIIVFAVALGLLARKFGWTRLTGTRESNLESLSEEEYVINNRSTPTAITGFRLVIRQIVVAAALWVLPVVLFYVFAGNFSFWFKLTTFFTKAALVTFGGAYAVLPYVAQVSVEKFQWLTEYQMIDGLALGETTPGPLIMILAFVGFMAGYNTHSSSLLAGTGGLVATTYYTFLPSFLFIFIGAPWVERTHSDARLKESLSIITAAVVGVIFNLSLFFGKAIVFHQGLSRPDWYAIVWMILSIIFLHKLKTNMMLWIGISALAGLAYYLVAG